MSSCKKLQCLSFSGSKTFREKDVYKDDGTSYRALLENGEDMLRAEIRYGVAQQDARSDIATQTVRMKTLFSDVRSPYPGDVSKKIVCEETLKPAFESTIQHGIEVSSFAGYLNDRLTYGVCSEEQAVYRSTLALFYCPKQQAVYHIEIITPKKRYEQNAEKYQEMLRSLACL